MAMEFNRTSLRLASDARAALVKYGARASWPAGFTVYERGAPADGLFVVLAGRIVLRSRVKAGRGFVPSIAAAGETFGAEGLVPGAGYVTDARAEEASETLHLSAAQVRAFLREQPLHGSQLLAQLLRERTELLEKLRELATLSVEERLLAAMVRLADQADHADGAPLVVGPNQYRLLCELVGATRESVSLVFTRLAAAGLVERDGVNYHVPDVAALGGRLRAAWFEGEALVPMAIADEGKSARGGRTARI